MHTRKARINYASKAGANACTLREVLLWAKFQFNAEQQATVMSHVSRRSLLVWYVQ